MSKVLTDLCGLRSLQGKSCHSLLNTHNGRWLSLPKALLLNILALVHVVNSEVSQLVFPVCTTENKTRLEMFKQFHLRWRKEVAVDHFAKRVWHLGDPHPYCITRNRFCWQFKMLHSCTSRDLPPRFFQLVIMRINTCCVWVILLHWALFIQVSRLWWFVTDRIKPQRLTSVNSCPLTSDLSCLGINQPNTGKSPANRPHPDPENS